MDVKKNDMKKQTAILATIGVLVLFGILGEFKKPLYGYCLAVQVCKMPALQGLDVRMKPNWIPEIYALNGEQLLAFEKDGKSLSDGGVVIKFLRDPSSSKLLATRFARKSYSWGVGYQGTSEMLKDVVAPPATAFYLVVPELELLVTSNYPSAFDEIERIASTSAKQ